MISATHVSEEAWLGSLTLCSGLKGSTAALGFSSGSDSIPSHGCRHKIEKKKKRLCKRAKQILSHLCRNIILPKVEVIFLTAVQEDKTPVVDRIFNTR